MRKAEEFAAVQIQKQEWQEFVACYIQKCLKDNPDTPVRVVLERMIDSREETAMRVIYGLMSAAWAEVAQFADRGNFDEGERRWKRLKA